MAADLIVVHGISLPPGEFGGPWIDRLFTNDLPAGAHPYFAEIEGQRVSSHLYIRRDGGVTQYVKFGERAWHAGQSSWEGRSACNDFSIGVELEGADTVRTTPCSTGRSRGLSPRSAKPIPRCRPIAWWGIATSHRAGRPIRGPGSTGLTLAA